MPLDHNDVRHTPALLFSFFYLYPISTIEQKCWTLFFIIKALVLGHKHFFCASVIVFISAVSLSASATPYSESEESQVVASTSPLTKPSTVQFKKLSPVNLRKEVKKLHSKKTPQKDDSPAPTNQEEVATTFVPAKPATPQSQPIPRSLSSSDDTKAVIQQPKPTNSAQYKIIGVMPNGDEIIQAQPSGTPEQPEDDSILPGNYKEITKNGTQILVHEKAQLSDRQVVCLAITTCAVTECGILNSLSFIGDNPTVGQVIKGAAQCIGINASIGVMFGDSYHEAMTKILGKYNQNGFCPAFCGCLEGCSSGKCSPNKTAWIVLPAIAGLTGSMTDALNTQSGVLNVLNSCCSESLCTYIFSRIASGVNLFSESFLYIKGTKGVWQSYKNLIGAAKHCDLPNETVLRKLLTTLHESADSMTEMTDISPEESQYLTEILTDTGKYRMFARFDKAFTEEKASSTPKLADTIKDEETWGKHKAQAHTLVVSTLLTSIGIYLTMGMAAPVIKGALASGLGAKAIMSTPWPQAVSSFNCSWDACCGYTAIVSYVVQSISLAPVAMQTVSNVITPILLIPWLTVSDTLLGREDFAHHWVALKDSLPKNWRGWLAGAFGTLGTGLYLWAYSGINTHIKNIMTSTAETAVKPCLAGCYYLPCYNNCIPAATLIPSIGNAFICCILCHPSYRIWTRLFNSPCCNRATRKVGEACCGNRKSYIFPKISGGPQSGNIHQEIPPLAVPLSPAGVVIKRD